MRQVGAACMGERDSFAHADYARCAREAWLQKQNAPHQAESELNPLFGHEKWVQFKV